MVLKCTLTAPSTTTAYTRSSDSACNTLYNYFARTEKSLTFVIKFDLHYILDFHE